MARLDCAVEKCRAGSCSIWRGIRRGICLRRRASALRLGRGAALDQVQAPVEYDDVLLGLLWHPVVFPLVRALIGDDAQMIDNDYFITPPHTPRQGVSPRFTRDGPKRRSSR